MGIALWKSRIHWIRISKNGQMLQINNRLEMRAYVSVVIMTSQSSWIKSSNWKKVTQEECAAIMRSQFPLLLYYAVLVGQILVNACAPYYQGGFVQVTLRHWMISSSVLKWKLVLVFLHRTWNQAGTMRYTAKIWRISGSWCRGWCQMVC